KRDWSSDVCSSDLVEVFYRSLLLRKYFDDFLAGHHLLDVSIQFTRGTLPSFIQRTGPACNEAYSQYEDRYDCNGQQRQQRAQVEHDTECPQQCDDTCRELDERSIERL